MTDKQQVLSVLMPISTALLNEPSRLTVSALHDVIQTLDSSVLQELGKYVIFPLFYTLRLPLQDNNKQDLLTDICRCLEYFLSRTTVSQWDIFRDIFSCVTCKLGSPEAKGRVCDLSEELKLAIVKVLQALVRSGTKSIHNKLYSAASLPPMGHAVTVLLWLAEHEQARELKIVAMECLLQLSQADNKYKDSMSMYGDTFSSFLPGISMSLCRIVKGDSRQGQGVIVKALEVWWKIVCLVVGDAALSHHQTTNNNFPDAVDERIKGLVVERTEEWVKSTTSKLVILVKQIATLKTHSNWRVRMALVKWAEMLLKSCSRSMSESVSVFLEVLVCLLIDEYDSVSTQCRRVLTQYNKTCEDSSEARPLTEILEENLYALTTSLPRQIRMADEEEKLAVVNLLGGYLALLGPNVNSLLRSFSHLKRLSLALVQSLEIDCTDLKIIEERTTISGHEIGIVNSERWNDILKPRKFYQHFRDRNIEKGLLYVCNVLGQYGDIHILIDHFLDLFQETQVYRLAATVIMNEIVAGTVLCQNPGKELFPDYCTGSTYNPPSAVQNIIRMLIDEYLSSFNLTTSVKEKSQFKSRTSVKHSLLLAESGVTTSPRLAVSSDTPSVAVLNRNIMQICLFIEGIGTVAKVLGEDFKPMLIKVLYPLMEKLGDGSAYISSSAYLTLIDICKACHYRSIEELIMENADYLINEISLRLRHLPDNLQTPLVLQAMLHHSSERLLPVVHDTILEILSSLDDHYTDQAVLFMKVLSELTKAVVRWFPHSQKKEETCKETKSASLMDTSESRSERERKSLADIQDFFLDYHKQKQLAKGIISEDEDTDEATQGPDAGDVEEEDEDENKTNQKDLPKHIVAVKEVLLRSRHLLSSASSAQLRLLVLDCVSDACTALQDWKDELLPLIHQLWQPFSLRFDDEEKLVAIQAVSTLRKMADICGDFICRRTFKDVIPKMVNFLTKQAHLSVKSSPAYQYTINYKYQLACLAHIGYIARQIGASVIDVEKLAKSCLPYLSVHQCKPLQEASMTSVQHLIQLEPDLMWLSLHRLYSPSDLVPPAPCFKPVKVFSEPGKSNEFTDNVIKLLPLT
ncbi:TELO2-interacting protein 1 homolog [Gigantopelta aegis]|uniref:TELO2-interacting protein 1 homolog n=1 Tax=Gigantopelta aegis TaxID=1735272 RepID=UPI001B8883CD|nr:TELO2-interacting protein 1 homolog [Gigantopelta aegis]XP_041375234.1 TELO2-interacting protein 1 homolog [Gigantopelta aegis]